MRTPLRHCSAFVALVGTAVFIARAPGAPTLYDAPALVSAVWDLAASHPPGQPLYTVLGRLVVTVLPVGPVAFRLAVFSSLVAGIAAWLAGRLAASLVGGGDGRAAHLASAATTLAVLCSPPLVRQAARVEVYPLALALTLASMLAIRRWASSGHLRDLLRASFAAGLVLAVHPPHALAALGLGFAVVLTARRDVWRRPAPLALGAVACAVGASSYLLLPVRAHAGALQWGDPTTLHDFLRYVTGAPYHRNLGAASSSAVVVFADAARYVLFACGGIPFVGMVLLNVREARPRESRDLMLGLTTGALLALVALCLQPLDERIPDRVAYAGPCVALCIALGAAGFARLEPSIHGPALAVLALNVTSLPMLPGALSQDFPVFETIAGALADTPGARALVLPSSDFASMSFRVMRSVEGLRPDLAVLPTGTIEERWEWRKLEGHPCFPIREGVRLPDVPRDEAESRRLHVALAVDTVRDCVEIASEKQHEALPPVAVAGTLLVSSSRAARLPSRSTRRMGERLAPIWEREARRAAGDHDAVGSLLRNIALNRARRLLARGDAAEALRTYGRVLGRLDAERGVGGAVIPSRVSRAVPVVHDPRALFEASREDAEREAAVGLFRTGNAAVAEALLRAQLERGDVRALLQQAWLALASGNRADAEKLVAAFELATPARAEEAAALRRILRSVAAPARR